jgi:DNA invertase Pin-like site-specific DNA recombinase
MSTRATIYTRISDARGDDTAGVDRQREDCLALCAERGWDVVAVHEDNNVSAMKRKVRPAYTAMLEDVREGRCEVVVCWATDRLYRQPRDLEGLVEALGSVQVATVKSGKVDLSTADGRMVARLLGNVSAHESEKRGERVARAAAQRAKNGGYGGGRRRMGYTDTATELVPDEAEGIRWAYGIIAAGGSLESVVRNTPGSAPARSARSGPVRTSCCDP